MTNEQLKLLLAHKDRYRSRYPLLTAISLAQEHGAKVFPTHGIIRSVEGAFECSCGPRARNEASRKGHVATPCTAPGKYPSVKWVEWATDQYFPLWYHNQHYPSDNFAVMTGPDSGFWGLDFDGAPGMGALAKLEKRFGTLTGTWAVKSGSAKGGLHLYFALPDGCDIHNSESKVAPSVDVRGWHGYLLLADSIHKSGNPYTWVEGRAPNETPLLEAPPGLVELALRACKKTNPDVASPQQRRKGKSSTNHKNNVHDASAVIGDGEGRGGFHRPINSLSIRYWAAAGEDGNADALKEALREAIANAPSDNHEAHDIQRYLSDDYLDEAIESARQYVMEGKM